MAIDPNAPALPPEPVETATGAGQPTATAAAPQPAPVAPAADPSADPLDAAIPGLDAYVAANPYTTAADAPPIASRPATRDLPASWSRERIIRLQRQMQMAGLLVPPYRQGVWDARSSQAYQQAVAEANNFGVGVDQALTKLSDASVAFPAVEPTLQNISPADLARNLKTLWKQFLGRDPTTDELAEFTQEVAGMRAQAEAGNVEFQETVQEAAYDAGRTGTPEWANMPALEPGEEEPGLVTEEDMGARISEFFEQRYGREIAGVEEAAETRESVAAGAGLFGTDWGANS